MILDMLSMIGLGSNLGDRLERLRAAVRGVARDPGIRVIACSSVYCTAPVGPVKDQPEFLNAVCEVTTNLSPRELLGSLLHVEALLGRTRDMPQGPRNVDLDLLLYDDLVVEEPGLVVPHPRLHERAFVMVPLCELHPDLVLPGSGEPLREILERLPNQRIECFAPPTALT